MFCFVFIFNNELQQKRRMGGSSHVSVGSIVKFSACTTLIKYFSSYIQMYYFVSRLCFIFFSVLVIILVAIAI
eukprot:UN24198